MNKLQRHALNSNVADKHYNMHKVEDERRAAADGWGSVLTKMVVRVSRLKLVSGGTA